MVDVSTANPGLFTLNYFAIIATNLMIKQTCTNHSTSYLDIRQYWDMGWVCLISKASTAFSNFLCPLIYLTTKLLRKPPANYAYLLKQQFD
jgi:hypothetical protein